MSLNFGLTVVYISIYSFCVSQFVAARGRGANYLPILHALRPSDASVRPPTDGRTKARYARARRAVRQQQLEQQKQALWRLAQPGGTETTEPWPTRSHFQSCPNTRCLLDYFSLIDILKYTKYSNNMTYRRWFGELSQGNAGARRKEGREEGLEMKK